MMCQAASRTLWTRPCGLTLWALLWLGIAYSCVLAYGTVAPGPLSVDNFPGLGLDPVVGTGTFEAIISLFVVAKTNPRLEKIMVVFSSFATLLMLSIANVLDPIGTFLALGTNPNGFVMAVGSAVPLLVLSSLMYQNIVPSITNQLDFNRATTTATILIRSLIPVGMYIAWCYGTHWDDFDGTTACSTGAATFSQRSQHWSCLYHA